MTIYTLYNELGEVLYAKEFEEQPENSTDLICQVAYLKPMFNKDTKEFYEGATPEEIKAADPRTAPDYYLVREQIGKELVNEVSNILLADYKAGIRTLAQVMAIEESLKEVIYSLRGGQFITASYKLAISQNVPVEMKIDLSSRVQNLMSAHYAN